eukprot:SAG31_NODE_9353_length_1291_cov_0.920302_1_plen_47_part_10
MKCCLTMENIPATVGEDSDVPSTATACSAVVRMLKGKRLLHIHIPVP